uniref:Uncharacterized protein n=1 Tax=Anguilla anguilla TaxID=7936 RepID=A0A0E9PVQ6_ANGAN
MKSNASKIHPEKQKYCLFFFVFVLNFNSILFLSLIIVCVLLLGNSLDL